MADAETAEGLPSGFVTFVFTDIEGSTRLYKALGEATAGDVFDLHNKLLRAAWTANNGHEVHTEGDSFFVAFEDPNDAVAACVDARQRLAAATWPQGGDVKIRVGIHCGLAAPRNGDYMALCVHQAARVMSAAHGGQILITDAAVQRISLLPGHTTTRVGAFRLRDFDEPPLLYRVDPPGLPPTDMPPRALPANQHNLVLPLTTFVGRDADLVTVNGLLEPGRAVTLVGLGGMGKTRLATEVGIEVAPAWEAGVWMVELAEVLDPELIINEVATAIGVGAASAADQWRNIVERIGDQHMLLILDNVEQLIERCAQLVPQLLRACPNVSVLATSREPLNCAGEVIYRLQPLELNNGLEDPTTLPSVELFIDRARAVSTGFVWSPDSLEQVVEICRHLDGLPLAIEIAAAQVGVLQLSEILDGLSNRFKLLRSRDRALPSRQRTMEGLLGWSYRLLTEPEQRAFRRLAVFGGSFSIDAAEAALAGDGIDGDDVPELVWSLVDKSLIAADLTDSATRYRLFESVQRYAMRLLIDNDDPVRAGLGLANWLLERVAPWQVQDRRWLGAVAVEIANIRTIVDLAGEAEPELVQQLMCSVARYHDTMQSYQVGIDELSRDVESLKVPTPTRGVLLGELAYLHLRMANSDKAVSLLDQASEIQKEAGRVEWNDVAVERARGELGIRAGDFASVVEIASDVLKSQQLSPQGTARMWSLIGIAESSRGNAEQGEAALEKALTIYSDLGDAPHIAIANANVAEAAWRLQHYEKAARHQRLCLDDGLSIGQLLAITTSLIMASQFAELRADWQRCVLLLAHAQSMMADAGHELYEDEDTATRDAIERATTELGAEAVVALTEQGKLMSVIDAAALAVDIFDHEIAFAPSTHCS